ncbi:hypothetical protein IEQ44_03110 [Nocardioides sp. Y6]|uniref:30S ribosomal protein S12 n=1 Tax=Nocardioides malaquae TaxID=2773426 RepID=A0ABR9RR67_9ACTN|nr:hypothetical protein [Nocardioides malaquae]MBE7323640.1 hypothetical protein [Nocardioides malaquae]
MGKGRSTSPQSSLCGELGASAPKKGKKKQKAAKKSEKKSDKLAGKQPTVAKLPKKKCCESKTRCGRCPLRMLKEGTLPEGYTVHRRKLVKVSAVPQRGEKKKSAA